MMRRVLIALCAVALLGAPAVPAADAPAARPTRPDLDLIARVLGIVETEYVEPVNEKKAIEAAISGMLGALDPHSSYMTQEAYDEMKVQTRGAYGGLGLEITQENGLVKIVSPIDDTPAAQAGLQPHDLISRLNA